MGDASVLNTSTMVGNQLFLGSFIFSASLGDLEYLHDAAVCVDTEGKIIAVEKDCDEAKVENEVYAKLGWSKDSVTVTSCKTGQFFFPGFIGQCLLSQATHLSPPLT
jgi:guanine deaminase